MTAFLGAFALVAMMSTTITKPTPEREPNKCTHWRGTVSGNDPSVSVTATLCPAAKNRVTGTLVWESKRSGTNTRTLEGTRSGGAFTLRDVALTGTPNPGWVFCKIDRYDLVLSGDDKLDGTYHSSACRDNATIELARVR